MIAQEESAPNCGRLRGDEHRLARQNLRQEPMEEIAATALRPQTRQLRGGDAECAGKQARQPIHRRASLRPRGEVDAAEQWSRP
jgi:hypothetical protein